MNAQIQYEVFQLAKTSYDGDLEQAINSLGLDEIVDGKLIDDYNRWLSKNRLGR